MVMRALPVMFAAAEAALLPGEASALLQVQRRDEMTSPASLLSRAIAEVRKQTKGDDALTFLQHVQEKAGALLSPSASHALLQRAGQDEASLELMEEFNSLTAETKETLAHAAISLKSQNELFSGKDVARSALLQLLHLDADLESSAVKKATDGYLCRDGRGQPGQNYFEATDNRMGCQSKCDTDAACSGFTFAGNVCKLFGGNVPSLTKNAFPAKYCLRTTFAMVPDQSIPGDGTFKPAAEWLAKTLQVPLTGSCKQLGGGGNKGASGAQFFSCSPEYKGSKRFPSLGLPDKLFVKIRTPQQLPHEFDNERQVYALSKSLPEQLPIPQLLSGERNYMIQQSAGSGVDSNYSFTDTEMKALMENYAQLHSSFWGMDSERLDLKSVEEWAATFAALALSTADIENVMQKIQVPEETQERVRRFEKEVGRSKAVEYMRSTGVTLVQGDAHNGQILKGSDGTWKLVDFGWAHMNSPAVDVGSFLGQNSKPESREEYVNYYWNHFTDAVGSDGSLPSQADFLKLFNLGAFLRGNFYMLMWHYGAFSDPKIWDTPGLLDAVTPFLECLDDATIDYLAEKTKNTASFLALSRHTPDEAVLKALAERELSQLQRL